MKLEARVAQQNLRLESQAGVGLERVSWAVLGSLGIPHIWEITWDGRANLERRQAETRRTQSWGAEWLRAGENSGDIQEGWGSLVLSGLQTFSACLPEAQSD